MSRAEHVINAHEGGKVTNLSGSDSNVNEMTLAADYSTGRQNGHKIPEFHLQKMITQD